MSLYEIIRTGEKKKKDLLMIQYVQTHGSNMLEEVSWLGLALLFLEQVSVTHSVLLIVCCLNSFKLALSGLMLLG